MNTSYQLAPDNKSIKTLSSRKSSTAYRKPKNSGICKQKNSGLKCYGFLADNGELDAQLFTSKTHAYIAGTVIAGERQQGTFVNCEKEASWLCVSTFKNTKDGRTEENISHILCSGLDLDGNSEIQITEDVVIQRCCLLGLPLPLTIETSPNRYHAKWYYRTPLSAEQLPYWKLVQRALYEAFKDLGADPKALDAVRFLRNEKHPKAVIREKGVKCSLSQIYRSLKGHGYIKQAERIPLEVSRRKLMAFFRANNGTITATYKELARLTGIALRTLELLVSEKKNEGYLTTEIIGTSRNKKTAFTMRTFVPHKEIFNSCNAGFLSVLDSFLSQGARSDKRNYTVFASCLELKIKKGLKISFSEAVALLVPGFLLSDPDPVFSRREFEGCIRSALKVKYRFPYSKRKLIALGLLEDESSLATVPQDNVPAQDVASAHSPDCDCGDCLPYSDTFFDLGAGELVVLKGNSKLGLPEIKLGAGEKEILDSHLERIKKLNLERGFR